MVRLRLALSSLLLVVSFSSLPAQTLLTRTSIPLGEYQTQAGKLVDGERTYTPFLFAFSSEDDLLLADVYKNRVGVYTLDGRLKTSWTPGLDYGPWISFFYGGATRILWGDARVLLSGPLRDGPSTQLNLRGLFPTYRGFSGGKLSLGTRAQSRSETLVLSEDLSTSQRVYQTGQSGEDTAVVWGWGEEYHPGNLVNLGEFLGNEPGGPAFYIKNESGRTLISQVNREGSLVKTYVLPRQGTLPESGLWTVYQPGKVVAQLYAWEDRVEVVRWRLE